MFFRKSIRQQLLNSLVFSFLLSTVASVSAQLPTEDPPHGELHPLLAETIKAGPFKPQWASLVTHQIPDWFQRDKVGLSAHWGPYAVPGWTPRK
ncbi:MAG: alpha-L-fucosidase, partial [Pseudomonadales bacterium]